MLDLPMLDFRGRIELTATVEAIDFIEREGKRIIHSYEVKNGRLVPTVTMEDWPVVLQLPKGDGDA